jgi:hypothetical protein
LAGEVPPAHEAPGSASRWPRDWLSFEQYRDIHDRYLEVLYRDGYVDSHDLQFTKYERPDGRIEQVSLEASISCAAGVVLLVTKYMDVRYTDKTPEVLSTYYRYHAQRAATGQPVIRYDCGHEHLHYHRFDEDGHEIRRDPLPLQDMPRLDAVIREAVDLARSWDAPAG